MEKLNGRLFVSIMAARHDPDTLANLLEVMLDGRTVEEITSELANSTLNLLYTITAIEEGNEGLTEELNEIVQEYALQLEEYYGG